MLGRDLVRGQQARSLYLPDAQFDFPHKESVKVREPAARLASDECAVERDVIGREVLGFSRECPVRDDRWRRHHGCPSERCYRRRFEDGAIVEEIDDVIATELRDTCSLVRQSAEDAVDH